jgi:outer membrane receptor for ferrienterochelin and colicin
MKNSLIPSFLFLLFWSIMAPASLAQVLHGLVVEQGSGPAKPLPGATVVWLGTRQGTATDSAGHFSLQFPAKAAAHQIVVSFVGYQPDTLHVHGQTHVRVVLRPVELAGVTIRGDRTDELNPIRTELITTQDLRKAACCNLSESFETQASVDTHLSDAVTGTKQIQVLGLDGIYTQITAENIPAVRGLAARSGLNFIPGTWIRSIDVSKGTGSVVNGYESTTGQINVELVKPQESERFFYNAYLSQFGRLENNLHLARKLNKQWSTALLLHGSTQRLREDGNDDGFLDIPLFNQVNALNRWSYQGKNIEAQFGAKALYDDRLGGQTSFRPEMARTRQNPYGLRQQNRRLEAFGKMGILLPGEHESIGLIASVTDHNIQGYWGLNNYTGRQQYLTFNGIYQNKFGERHGLKAGASLTADNYRENYNGSLYQRRERVAGVFAEYAFNLPQKFTAVAGLRYDQHNLFGGIVTPRLHLKYNLAARTTLRASAGRGFRYANVIMENLGFLVSSRQFEIDEQLRPEIAWNYGLSLHQKYTLLGRDGSLTLDLFRTQFQNQVIVDLDTDVRAIQFYNLKGQSFANSLQLQTEYELWDDLTLTAAYKYYNVRAQIGNLLRQVPFIPRERVFVNLAYDLRRWRFDATMQWYGARRLPRAPRNNIDEFGYDHTPHGGYANGQLLRREEAPDYFLFNAQVTKVFRTWEVYLGMENLGNMMQHHPIVGHDQPFGQDFDAGITWAPIMGRMLYAGVRVSIE